MEDVLLVLVGVDIGVDAAALLEVEVPVEVAVEGKRGAFVETGEFDFRVKVGV